MPLAPIPKPPDYKPDGLDHSLTCDPIYSLLLQYKTTISSDGCIQINNFALRKVKNKDEILKALNELARHWTTNHMYQYCMNTMSSLDYWQIIVSPYAKDQIKRVALKRAEEDQKRKEKQAEEDRLNRRVEDSLRRYHEPSGSGLSGKELEDAEREFQRMQNISEYGW
jgi:hypothetical protein